MARGRRSRANVYEKRSSKNVYDPSLSLDSRGGSLGPDPLLSLGGGGQQAIESGADETYLAEFGHHQLPPPGNFDGRDAFEDEEGDELSDSLVRSHARGLIASSDKPSSNDARRSPPRIVALLCFLAVAFALGAVTGFYGRGGGGAGGGERVFPTFSAPACGVYYYYHVSKNGGTSVMEWQKQMANAPEENGVIEYVELMDTFGDRDPMFWDGEFRRIAELIFSRKLAEPGQQKRWVSVHHHHRVPGLHYAMPLLRQWRRDLAEQGCELVLATTLREPQSRTESLVFFNQLPRDRFDPFVLEEKESQVYYLLYNTCQPMPDVGEKPTRCEDPSVWVQTQNRTQGEIDELLGYLSKDFDLVGRTDDLGRFLERSELHTGWRQARTALDDGKEPHSLPSERPYEVDDQMKQLIAEHTRSDQQLWNAVFGGDG